MGIHELSQHNRGRLKMKGELNILEEAKMIKRRIKTTKFRIIKWRIPVKGR